MLLPSYALHEPQPPASEYVVSDLGKNKPDTQSHQFADPSWPKTAPEPEVGITDRDGENKTSSFSFEEFLGGVTQAALLRPDYEVVDDRAVSSVR